MLTSGLCAVLALSGCGSVGAVAADASARAQAKAAAPGADVQADWSRLRAAVLAHDLARIAGVTSFPLIVHGVTDDEVKHVARPGFAAVFDTMLMQRPDGAGSPSNLDRIRATPSVKDPGAGFVVTVGGMELKRTPGGLRLVRIYVDDE